jgi:hypothetical protein
MRGMSAASARFGTLAWAQSNAGALSLGERAREIAKGAVVVLRTAPAQLRQRLGLRNPRAFAYDVDRLPIPDSSIARQAEELCRDASAATLVNHCLRTYAWGMVLAAHDGLRPDPELFYVASLLHDLALTDRYRDYAPMPCFGARAALLASDWARTRGWSPQRCTTLADAISLHLNVSVPAVHGPEAQSLQAGAGLDVIGLRHWQLAPPTVAAVLRRFPRHDMKRTFPLFVAEAHPRTRTQLLVRWLMFGALLRYSQFDE